MTQPNLSERRRKNPPKPLNKDLIQELALSYVARFATTSAKLESYLSRKLRERGWSEGQEKGPNPDDCRDSGNWPDLSAISARFVELGYIDDEAYARSRSGGLLRRGYGPRRVSQALHQAGVDENIRNSVAPGELAIRRSALALARKRGFGPFAAEPPERERREKQIAAMLRAGHGFDAIRAIMDAESAAVAEQWVADAEQEDC